MSVKQKELYDIITHIDDVEIPRIIRVLQIFVSDDYATPEELKAIKDGESQIANGEYYTSAQVQEMFD